MIWFDSAVAVVLITIWVASSAALGVYTDWLIRRRNRRLH